MFGRQPSAFARRTARNKQGQVAETGKEANTLANVPTEKIAQWEAAVRERELNTLDVKITGLETTILKAKDIKRLAVVEVKNKESSGSFSLFDPLMGPTDDSRCQTCMGNRITCPGHSGYINFESGYGDKSNKWNFVPHPSYVKQIIHILTSVCNTCYGTVVPIRQLINARVENYGERLVDRLAAIANMSVDHECSAPNYPGHKITTALIERTVRDVPPELLKKPEIEVASVMSEVLASMSRTIAELEGLPANQEQLAHLAELRQIFAAIQAQPSALQKAQMIRTQLMRPIVQYQRAFPKCPKNPRFKATDIPEEVILTQDDRPIYHMNDVHTILATISQNEEVCSILGFKGRVKPVDLLIKRIMVPPPRFRQPIMRGKKKVDSEWTLALKSIISHKEELRNAQRLRSSEQSNMVAITSSYNQLIAAVTRYMRKPSDRDGGKKAVNFSIESKMTGKGGVMRGRVAGKRVNFSGRAVAVLNADLPSWMVNIPQSFVRELTQHERVFDHNLRKMQALLANGKVVYIRKGRTGQLIEVARAELSRLVLEVGDEVDRELTDGDLIIVNRQPTIHAPNVLAFEVRIWAHEVIGINIFYTKNAFNLDFDGDELNIHAVQTIDAQVELRELLFSQNCLINPQTVSPIPGALYDAPPTAFMLTRESLESKKDMVIIKGEDLLFCINAMQNFEESDRIVPESIVGELNGQTVTLAQRLRRAGLYPLRRVLYSESGQPITEEEAATQAYTESFEPVREALTHIRGDLYYTGKACFSATLPPDLQYRKKDVLIRNGILLRGTITKSDIGASEMDIFQTYLNQVGITAQGIQKISFMMTNMIFFLNAMTNFIPTSLGIEDCIPSSQPTTQELVLARKEGRRPLSEVEKVQNKLDTMALTIESWGVPEPHEQEEYERKVGALVNAVEAFGRTLLKEFIVPEEWNEGVDQLNCLYVLAQSGGKASPYNVSQIRAFVGQMFLESRRLEPLSQRDLGTTDVTKRGFCRRSWMQGITPTEMWSTFVAARESQIDTSGKTPIVGDISNMITKASENLKVDVRGPISEGGKNVITYIYGNDGLDPRKMVRAQGISTPVDLLDVLTKMNRGDL